MTYTIGKILKTKTKDIFTTEDQQEFMSKVKELALLAFRKPYFFTYIYAEDQQGKAYALRTYVKINGGRIPVSPQEVADLLKI